MNTQKTSQLEVFFKNITTGLDRFFKPYDLIYSFQNTKHVKLNLPIQPKDTIFEYYTRVFLAENPEYVTGSILIIKPKNVRFEAQISSAKTITFDKAQYATFKKAVKAIKSNSYDCVIMPEVLNNVLEHQEVVKEVYRILKPGGVVLTTAVTISTPNLDNFWGFTASGFRYMFGQVFDAKKVHDRSYGNALVGRLFLEKKKAADLTVKELNYSDLYFPVVVAVRATK